MNRLPAHRFFRQFFRRADASSSGSARSAGGSARIARQRLLFSLRQSPEAGLPVPPSGAGHTMLLHTLLAQECGASLHQAD